MVPPLRELGSLGGSLGRASPGDFSRLRLSLGPLLLARPFGLLFLVVVVAVRGGGGVLLKVSLRPKFPKFILGRSWNREIQDFKIHLF